MPLPHQAALSQAKTKPSNQPFSSPSQPLLLLSSFPPFPDVTDISSSSPSRQERLLLAVNPHLRLLSTHFLFCFPFVLPIAGLYLIVLLTSVPFGKSLNNFVLFHCNWLQEVAAHEPCEPLRHFSFLQQLDCLHAARVLPDLCCLTSETMKAAASAAKAQDQLHSEAQSR